MEIAQRPRRALQRGRSSLCHHFAITERSGRPIWSGPTHDRQPLTPTSLRVTVGCHHRGMSGFQAGVQPATRPPVSRLLWLLRPGGPRKSHRTHPRCDPASWLQPRRERRHQGGCSPWHGAGCTAVAAVHRRVHGFGGRRGPRCFHSVGDRRGSKKPSRQDAMTYQQLAGLGPERIVGDAGPRLPR